MCGRARFRLAPEPMARACKEGYNLDVDVGSISDEAYYPSENGSPGALIGVLHPPITLTGDTSSSDKGPLTLSGMRWGLVPSFTKQGSKPDFYKMFNARSETVTSKGIFSRLLKGRRCIVAVDGFFEWRQEHKIKQPYYIHFKGKPLLFAGLYDCWKDGEASEPMHTCTILTTEASKRFQTLHDRMPVILPTEAACMEWLGCSWDDLSSSNWSRYLQLCKPYTGQDLVWHPVTTKVNKAQYKESDCARELKRGSITSFFSPSPKKKPKLERGSDPATTATTKHDENTCLAKADPGIKTEHVSTLTAESDEVPAQQSPKEELKDEPAVKDE